jgi:hypothetical protein
MAPIAPLRDLKDKSKPDKEILNHDLVKELRKKYDEKINENKQSWREMICAGEIIALFIEGEQILRINSFNGMPRVVKPDRNDPQHIKSINKMQFYATTWQDKWRSSKPDILVSPLSNTDEAIAQARKANTVVDYLESQFFSTWYDLQEGLNAQVWGWYGRRVKPDHTAKSFHAFKEIWGEKEVEIGKGYGRCEKCGYKGDKSKENKIGRKIFNACPKCGDLEYEYEAPISQLMPYKKGKEKVFLPDIICEPLLFPAVRFDLSKRAEESPWFITEKKIELRTLQRMFGNIRFPEGESGNDFGLDVIDDLAARGAAMNGVSDVSKEKQDKIVLTEMYLSPDDLYDIKIGKEEKGIEESIPKGRLSDAFPEGCVVIGINGMSLILGIYAECHKDSISSGVYHMKPMSGAGRGVSDAVEINKQFNRRYSQIDNFMAHRATPAMLTAENAIEPRHKRLIGTPGAVIPIKLQNFPEVKDLNQLLRPLQGESVPGDLIHVTFERLEQMMQTAYHITNFGGASPQGVKNNTATYAQINDANSDAIFSPTLAVKADVTVQTVKKGFYKWVKYTPESRFIPFKKERQNAVGIEISGKDVDGEYQWSYVQGSEAPKNKFTETQKRIGFFSMFPGGIPEYFMVKTQFPKQIAEIERDFDVNFETDNYDSVGEACRLRLDRAIKAMGKKQNPNYQQILFELEPSLLITEPNLKEQSIWFQNLLLQEEGLSMSNEQRELVSQFIIVLHELAKGVTMKEMVDQSEIQVAAQQPIIEAQQQQEQQAQEQQMGMQAQQMQVQQAAEQEQMAGQAISMVADKAEAEQARAHEQELADNEDAMEAVAMMQQMEEGERQRAADVEIAKQQKQQSK